MVALGGRRPGNRESESEMIRDTEIVFGDLKHFAERLAAERSSPAQVRRYFKSFVLQTQQLTDTMRKEFKGLTAEKWEASRFKGWNDTTNLFKELRNTETHQRTVTLRVDLEASFFEGVVVRQATNEEVMIKEFGADTPENRQRVSGGLVVQQVLDIGDPFADQSSPLEITFCDPDTGEPLPPALEPYRIDATYHLVPRTPEVEALLGKVDTDDVHSLAARCVAVLQDYYAFYKTELAHRGL